MEMCRIEGCDDPTYVKTRGLCRSHYEELRRQGAIGRRPKCSVEDCDAVAAVRGMCDKHYRRFLRKGTADRSPAWRFRNKYEVDPATGCWNWTDNARSGYGFLLVDRRKVMAHRFSYELHIGAIPEGMQLDHLCRNKLCVNPEHLEPVTQHENILRSDNLAARWARRTECHVCGGPLEERGDRRICRACERRRAAAWREANRERVREISRAATRRYRERKKQQG